MASGDRRFAAEVRSAGTAPQPGDVRGLARRPGDRGSYLQSRIVRSIRRVRDLQRLGDGHSGSDCLVCKFCRGTSRRAGQSESRVAASDQDRTDGKSHARLRRNRASACARLAQGRSGANRKKRTHPDRWRGRRRHSLCQRVGHYRRIRPSAQAAGYGHVLNCHGRHAARFRSITCSRHGRSRRELSRSHDPSRGGSQAAENAERDGAYGLAGHLDADISHRGHGDGAHCGLSAGAHQRRRLDRAACRAHSDYDRRSTFGHRHCRHRSHLSIQCPRHVRKSRRGRRRCAHASAR